MAKYDRMKGPEATEEAITPSQLRAWFTRNGGVVIDGVKPEGCNSGFSARPVYIKLPTPR